MNNKPNVVIIAWQSRNWRKIKKAQEFCIDYGMTMLMKNVFVGHLYLREYVIINDELKSVFRLPTDQIMIVTLCKNCSESLVPKIEDFMKTYSEFEIVTLPSDND